MYLVETGNKPIDPDDLEDIVLKKETYVGPPYESMSTNLKLALHEYFESLGVDANDFILFHYITDRSELGKFIGW